METLAKLFGDKARLEVLRLFLFNPESAYDVGDVAGRLRIRRDKASSVIKALFRLGIVKKKRTAKRRIGYISDQKFPYTVVLTDLLFAASVRADEWLSKKLSSAGKVKLVIVGGIFTRQAGARLDVLVVGDGVSATKLSRIMRSLEDDIGRELAYSSLSVVEFDYRLAMHDRMVRDVLDFPHIILVDRVGFERKNALK